MAESTKIAMEESKGIFEKAGDENIVDCGGIMDWTGEIVIPETVNSETVNSETVNSETVNSETVNSETVKVTGKPSCIPCRNCGRC